METEILSNGDWITERDLARKLGASVETMRTIREQLTEGEDWQRAKSGAVRYCPRAVAKICGEKNAGPDVVAEALAEPLTRTLYVRKRCGNPRILLAVIASEDVKKTAAVDVMTVRVKHSDRYVPGMVLEGCRQVAERVYEYAGKPPRRRGFQKS